MEGKALLRELREILQETSSGSWLNDRTSYDYLYEAVVDFNIKTHFLTNTQSITTGTATVNYPLNPDYCGMALTDEFNQQFIKYNNGTADSFIFYEDYSTIVMQNSSVTQVTPDNYTITDASAASSKTGTATSIGAPVNGEITLTDTAATFTTLAAGDFIHNTTTGEDGVVISITSGTVLVCALFMDGVGSTTGFKVSDTYIITPQSRYQVVLNPALSQAGTATIYYVQRPNPVYSPYRAYKIPFEYKGAIVKYAAFLYKYRDREPQYGDAFYKYYDSMTRKAASEMRKALPNRNRITVNLTKINSKSMARGSWNYNG